MERLVGGRSENVLLRHEVDVVGLLRSGVRHWSSFVPGERRYSHVKGRKNQMGKVSETTFKRFLMNFNYREKRRVEGVSAPGVVANDFLLTV